MKGSLHTDELMAAVVKRDTGLRTARRVSHCFVMDVPGHDGGADHHRRRGQHRAHAGGQGRHPAERDRPGARDGHRRSAGGDPLGDGDRQPEGAVHHRGRGAVQDGGPPPDHRRAGRRPAGAGQRDQPRGREDQEDRFAGGGPRQRAAGARPGGGQHARQEPVLPGGGRCRGHRARRAGADHPHQPGRFGADAAGLLRRRGAGRQGAPREPPRPWGDAMADVDPRAQRRLVEHQVQRFRRAAATSSRCCCKGQIEGLYTAPRFVGQGRARRRASARRPGTRAPSSGTTARSPTWSISCASARGGPPARRRRPPRRAWRPGVHAGRAGRRPR